MCNLFHQHTSGLGNLESRLQANAFSNSNSQNIFSKVSFLGKVRVVLPKFKMSLPMQPKKILFEMGTLPIQLPVKNFSQVTGNVCALLHTNNMLNLTIEGCSVFIASLHI